MSIYLYLSNRWNCPLFIIFSSTAWGQMLIILSRPFYHCCLSALQSISAHHLIFFFGSIDRKDKITLGRDERIHYSVYVALHLHDVGHLQSMSAKLLQDSFNNCVNCNNFFFLFQANQDDRRIWYLLWGIIEGWMVYLYSRNRKRRVNKKVPREIGMRMCCQVMCTLKRRVKCDTGYKVSHSKRRFKIDSNRPVYLYPFMLGFSAFFAILRHIIDRIAHRICRCSTYISI